MPSPRYTVRLPHALDAAVQARVQAGTPFAVLIREALAAYLADTLPTGAPTAQPTGADTLHAIQSHLAALTARVEILELALTTVPTPRRPAADRSADSVPTPADTNADSTPTCADSCADSLPTAADSSADTALTHADTAPPPTTAPRPDELPAHIQRIADARAQYDKLSERAFAQLLYDREIYRHRAKDGSDVRIPHTTLRQWLQQARDAGVL